MLATRLTSGARAASRVGRFARRHTIQSGGKSTPNSTVGADRSRFEGVGQNQYFAEKVASSTKVIFQGTGRLSRFFSFNSGRGR